MIGVELMKMAYQLRKAAGKYWLLHMAQEGAAYAKPIALNESGAEIWRMLEKGEAPERAAEAFAGCYGITQEEALSDIRQFIRQLEARGVIWDHTGDEEKWKFC